MRLLSFVNGWLFDCTAVWLCGRVVVWLLALVAWEVCFYVLRLGPLHHALLRTRFRQLSSALRQHCMLAHQDGGAVSG